MEKDAIRSLFDKGHSSHNVGKGLGGDPELIRLEARKGVREKMLQGSREGDDGGLS